MPTTIRPPHTLGYTLIHGVATVLFTLLSITVALTLLACDPLYGNHVQKAFNAAVGAAHVNEQVTAPIIAHAHNTGGTPVVRVKVEPTLGIPRHNERGKCKLVSKPKEVRVDRVEVGTEHVEQNGVERIIGVDAVAVGDTPFQLVFSTLPRQSQAETKEPTPFRIDIFGVGLPTKTTPVWPKGSGIQHFEERRFKCPKRLYGSRCVQSIRIPTHRQLLLRGREWFGARSAG